jgi:hypothetical protein
MKFNGQHFPNGPVTLKQYTNDPPQTPKQNKKKRKCPSAPFKTGYVVSDTTKTANRKLFL